MKCPTCGAELSPDSDVCPECTFLSNFEEVRASLSQRKRWGSRFRFRNDGRATGFRWVAALIPLSALVLGCGAYIYWQVRQTGWNTPYATSEPSLPRPAVKPSGSCLKAAKSAAQNVYSGLIRENPAAKNEWDKVLSLEKQSGGSYESRIALFSGFIESYPSSPESVQAREKLERWTNEAHAFHSAEAAEQDPSFKMCVILAQWQLFYTCQTTGLCRDFASNRIQYWTRNVESYLGDADLTVHSASGLTSAGLFAHGQPDPYFEIVEGRTRLYRSRTFRDNPSPTWNEKVRIYLWQGLELYLEIRDDEFIRSRLLVRRQLAPFPVDGPYQVTDGRIVVNLEIQRTR